MESVFLRHRTLVFILVLCGVTAFASNRQNVASADSITKIHYHCASMEEGQRLIVANTDYYNSLNQMDLDWRMRKKGATKEELVDFAKSCVQEFTDKEKERIAGAIAYIEKRLHEMGANLPFPKDDIVFIKTSMQEEGDAGAYTHKTEIYIGARDRKSVV